MLTPISHLQTFVSRHLTLCYAVALLKKYRDQFQAIKIAEMLHLPKA